MVWILLCKQIADYIILEILQTDCLPFGLLHRLLFVVHKNILKIIMVWENFFWKERYLPEWKIKRLQILCKYEVLYFTPIKKKKLLLFFILNWSQNNSICITNATVCLHFYKSKQTTALKTPKTTLLTALYSTFVKLLQWNWTNYDFLYTTLALSSPFIENITTYLEYLLNFYNNKLFTVAFLRNLKNQTHNWK